MGSQTSPSTIARPSPRPKVLHVVVAGQIGGAERFLADLVQRPEASGADHAIAAMTPNPDLIAHFRASGVTMHDRGRTCENPFAYLWRSYGPADIAWLTRIAAAENATLLHCHTYASHVLAARLSRRLGLPLVRTEHGVRHYRDPSCALNRHWALKQTTKIVAVSDFVARRVGAIEPKVSGRITVIRNGIDLTRFQPQPPRAEGPVRLLAVARLEPVKRLEIAIAAVARLPALTLDIVGDGAERARLERLADAAGGRVRFCGHQPDPRPFVAAADAVINCSREEALSLAILEAAAMSRPAIAFAQGGVPEAVVDGRTGWLAPDGGVETFAALLGAAAADRAELVRRGAAARAHVEAGFSVSAMCEAYGAVYRDLMTGEPHGS